MGINKEKMKKDLPPGTEFEFLFFEQYVQPNGWLDTNLETHALFWYYLNARRAYDEYYEKMEVVLEGDRDPSTHFEQLFDSIAYQYGVNPAYMANAWDLVDKQATLLGMPLLPDENRYRHRQKAILLQ